MVSTHRQNLAKLDESVRGRWDVRPSLESNWLLIHSTCTFCSLLGFWVWVSYWVCGRVSGCRGEWKSASFAESWLSRWVSWVELVSESLGGWMVDEWWMSDCMNRGWLIKWVSWWLSESESVGEWVKSWVKRWVNESESAYNWESR